MSDQIEIRTNKRNGSESQRFFCAYTVQSWYEFISIPMPPDALPEAKLRIEATHNHVVHLIILTLYVMSDR